MGVRPGGEAKCGTESGFSKHRRDGTEICRPCRDAANDANRRRRSGSFERLRMAPALCGTAGGYRRHLRSRPPTDPCVACKAGHALATRTNKARATGRPVGDPDPAVGLGESWASLRYNHVIRAATRDTDFGGALTYGQIATARGWDQP